MEAGTPKLADIRALHQRLQDWLVYTPILRCPALERRHTDAARVFAKLEFLQHTGTFKARGALTVMLALAPKQKTRGVTAVSAGNHAIATAYAAQVVGTTAKVVMLGSASPIRVEMCRKFGAEVVLADDVHVAFEMVEQIRSDEGRFFVHPFESPDIALGTATVGLEICEQVPDFDAIVVPIGGGGLCAGISSAAKQLRPGCRVFGVEPQGADSMNRSFKSGKPETLARVTTIADSLGAPFCLPLSFNLCRENVDDVVLVSDEELRQAMGLLFHEMKIAIEPACAATTAALTGPLRDRLAGKKVVLVMCGSNIDWHTYESHVDLVVNDTD